MSFPQTSILDDFNRTAENPLSQGGNWSSPWNAGAGHLATDGTGCSANTAFSDGYRASVTYGPDAEVFLTVTSVTGLGELSFGARLNNINSASMNGYDLDINGSTWSIRRYDNNTATTLGATFTQALSNGDAVGLQIIGSSVIAWYKASGGSWTELAVRADTTYASAGTLSGPWFDNTTAIFDNFGGGTITPPNVTTLGVTFNTTSGTKTVTATPAVGDLIVIITAHSGNTSDTAPTDNNSDGLGAYTAVETRVKASSADKIKVWIRNALVGSASSTVFTHAPGTSTGGGLAVLKVTNMHRTGASAKLRSGGQDNQAASTTPTVTWTGGGTPTGDNPVVGAVFNATNPATMTPPTGCAERHDVGYATPTTGLEVVTGDAGFNSSTMTWGNTSSAFASVALELDASVPPEQYLPPIMELIESGGMIGRQYI